MPQPPFAGPISPGLRSAVLCALAFAAAGCDEPTGIGGEPISVAIEVRGTPAYSLTHDFDKAAQLQCEVRFDIEATGYVGASGRTHARFEVEYELLFTNRLVLQPLFEAEVFGKSDPDRGIGAGLSTTDLGFRLRYEFRREIAPYIGVTWRNKWGKTADFAEAAGEDTGGARFVTGLRLWF